MRTAITAFQIQRKPELLGQSVGVGRNPESLQRAANEMAQLWPMTRESEYPMNERDLFSDLTYEQQTHLAERELSAFIAAVTELYGPEQARFSAEDWLDESDLMDRPPRSEVRDWRSVTIAASARLARRVDVIAASASAARRFNR